MPDCLHLQNNPLPIHQQFDRDHAKACGAHANVGTLLLSGCRGAKVAPLPGRQILQSPKSAGCRIRSIICQAMRPS